MWLHARIWVLVIGVFFPFAAFAPWPKNTKPFAHAVLWPKNSVTSGTVEFASDSKSLIVKAWLARVPAGRHTLHIVSNGGCSLPGHLNDLDQWGDLGDVFPNKRGDVKLKKSLSFPADANGSMSLIGSSVILFSAGEEALSIKTAIKPIACGTIKSWMTAE